MLKSKCILSDIEKDDGLRISIMSRHTLNDGKTPDKRITKNSFDIHANWFAPSDQLVGAYYRGEINFDTYEEIYRQELEEIKKRVAIINLIKQAKEQTVTVLCIEETPENCHRKPFLKLAKELANILDIDLEIEIK